MVASRGLVAGVTRVLANYRANPAARERTSALAAFGFIFSFGLFSFDYVITGGPDWNPGASAAPLEHARLHAQPLAEAPYEAPPTLPELDLTAYAPEGAVGELLGGPDTPLPNTPIQFVSLGASAPIPTLTPMSAAVAQKLKTNGV
jgi:hypothetical protein